MTYREKLLDPRWQKRRLEILSRDEWKCHMCEIKTETLHVHHRYYENGLEPWEYGDDALVTLCAGCHEHETFAIGEATTRLVRAAKKMFFADDINEIAAAMESVEYVGLLCSVLSWAMTDGREEAENGCFASAKREAKV